MLEERAEQRTATPRKKAVALRYDQDASAAPLVVASGQGLIAEKIMEVAHRHEVPIREDSVLAAALGQIEIGHEIPPELYRAVAEVLAFVLRVNRRVTGK